MYGAFAKGDIGTVIAPLDPQVEWWRIAAILPFRIGFANLLPIFK